MVRHPQTHLPLYYACLSEPAAVFGHQTSASSPEGSCSLPFLLGLVQGEGVNDSQEDMRPVRLGHAALGCT